MTWSAMKKYMWSLSVYPLSLCDVSSSTAPPFTGTFLLSGSVLFSDLQDVCVMLRFQKSLFALVTSNAKVINEANQKSFTGLCIPQRKRSFEYNSL